MELSGALLSPAGFSGGVEFVPEESIAGGVILEEASAFVEVVVVVVEVFAVCEVCLLYTSYFLGTGRKGYSALRNDSCGLFLWTDPMCTQSHTGRD